MVASLFFPLKVFPLSFFDSISFVWRVYRPELRAFDLLQGAETQYCWIVLQDKGKSIMKLLIHFFYHWQSQFLLLWSNTWGKSSLWWSDPCFINALWKEVGIGEERITLGVGSWSAYGDYWNSRQCFWLHECPDHFRLKKFARLGWKVLSWLETTSWQDILPSIFRLLRLPHCCSQGLQISLLEFFSHCRKSWPFFFFQP